MIGGYARHIGAKRGKKGHACPGTREASSCIQSMRMFGALVALALLLVSCAPAGLSCGEPTKLEPHPHQPGFTGPPLGPLLVRQFADEVTTAVIGYYLPGYATKVVTVLARPFDKPLTLRGWRCADGVPLRFAWVYPFGLNSTPAPPAMFKEAGEQAPVIQPTTSIDSTGVLGANAPPYFLFTSSGKWLIELREGATTVGRVVLLVP